VLLVIAGVALHTTPDPEPAPAYEAR
jgi:hypothetical protein